ncbi:hypothetical protein CXP39_00415 [Mesoplasma syrphidae]|uniref:Uncharacterized protein n=1 Tax=Mesoplasma syrphidae TaxID=225999 RepID=A0A2K9BMK3_9MOLU|nr:hypothetical protein [Mesoplasma syrphidae]AUF83273.1 hypothetical protein CXP39_00415 [Mesoplasma syrphidae]
MIEKTRLYKTAMNFNFFALVIWFLVGLLYGNILAGFVLCGISACWIIPMTIATKKAKDETFQGIERSHLALAICSMIFIWMISGLLILIAYTMCSKCKQNDTNIMPVWPENPNK